MSFNNSLIREFDSPLSSNLLNFDAAAAKLELTKLLLLSLENAASPMQDPGKLQGPQILKVEAARISALVTRAPPKSNVQSLAVSESIWQGEIEQVAQHVQELRGVVTRMGQKCDFKVKNVLSDRTWYASTSQCNRFTAL